MIFKQKLKYINSEKRPKWWVFLFIFLALTCIPEDQNLSEQAALEKQEDVGHKTAVDSSSTKKATKPDSLLVKSNTHIRKGEFSKALDAARQSLNFNKKRDDNRAIGNSLNKIATINYYQGRFFDALFYYDQSITFYKLANYKIGIASSTNNKGAVHYYLGNFPKALDCYKAAAELNYILDNKRQSANTTQNIGGIYIELEDFDNAMKHFQMAKKTYESISDKKSLSHVLNGIGEIHLRQQEYDQALKNFDEALRLANEVDDKQRTLEVMENLGDIHDSQGDFRKALEYYVQSSNLAEEIGNGVYRAMAKIAIGSTNLKLGELRSAIVHCHDGLKIAEEIKTISVQKEACDCLYDTYKATSRNAKALSYLEQSIVLQDSLRAKETADGVLNMQFEKQMLLDSIAHAEKQQEIEQQHKEDLRQKEKQRNIIVVVLGFMVLIAVTIWSRLNYVRKSKLRLQKEKDRSEHLLLNILPEDIAEELKEKGYVDAQNYESAAILFTDFKSFTATASRLNPQELVQELNICFKAFDIIIDQYKIEKIKTIGDSYMAAGGVPRVDSNAIKSTIYAALDMQEFMRNRRVQNASGSRNSFEMRVGIHVGPIIAGVVGVKKFQYDIWGDTVNTASRMESNGDVGKVNISKNTFLLVKDDEDLAFEYRGKIEVKGKGAMEMYFVSRIKKEGISLYKPKILNPSLT